MKRRRLGQGRLKSRVCVLIDGKGEGPASAHPLPPNGARSHITRVRCASRRDAALLPLLGNGYIPRRIASRHRGREAFSMNQELASSAPSRRTPLSVAAARGHGPERAGFPPGVVAPMNAAWANLEDVIRSLLHDGFVTVPREALAAASARKCRGEVFVPPFSGPVGESVRAASPIVAPQSARDQTHLPRISRLIARSFPITPPCTARFGAQVSP